MIKLLKRLFKAKRYFVVSYNFNSIDGRSGFGAHNFWIKGWFPPVYFIRNSIKYEHEIVDKESIIILSIMELSKKDYKDYTKCIK